MNELLEIRSSVDAVIKDSKISTSMSNWIKFLLININAEEISKLFVDVIELTKSDWTRCKGQRFDFESIDRNGKGGSQLCVAIVADGVDY